MKRNLLTLFIWLVNVSRENSKKEENTSVRDSMESAINAKELPKTPEMPFIIAKNKFPKIPIIRAFLAFFRLAFCKFLFYSNKINK